MIEGVDRTGKSTLARRISELWGAKVVHAGPPTRGCVEEYETALNGFDPTQDLILDRWHRGEYVWPKIFGRETDLDDACARHIEMFMESRGAYIVYATRDPEKLKCELVEHDEPLKPDDLDAAQSLFLRAGEPDAVWDYESCGDDEFDDIVGDACKKEDRALEIWDLCGPGFVGSLRPRVLYVGDEQGPAKSSREEPYQVPFAPFPATSGHYLMESLTDWHDAMIINARDRDTGAPYPLQRIWKQVGRPEVVALGKNAMKSLVTADVPHRAIPHPQYWRRFRHGEVEEYSRLLRGDAEWDW